MKEAREYFQYLKQLRSAGIKTVMGATYHLQKDFDLSYEEARKILSEWNREFAFTN